MTVGAGKCLGKGLDTADIGLTLLQLSADECISGIHERLETDAKKIGITGSLIACTSLYRKHHFIFQNKTQK
jgi:hypothetical protein